jgi:hypothetical protein
VSARAVKRCPRCGRFRPAGELYRRQGARLSTYCRSCQRAAARTRRRREDPAAAEQLRAVDRARLCPRRPLGGSGPSSGDTA